MIFIYIIAIILFLFAIIFFILLRIVTHHKPNTFPILKNRLNINKPVVVCLGDSNTHGNVSHDWVNELQSDLSNFQIFNAGLNSDLTFSLLSRLEDVIACNPAFINILIGTNDVNAFYSKVALKRYISNKKIGKNDLPNIDSFEGNLVQIIQKLKNKTNAKIAIMTLPLMGEDLNNKVNKIADNYSEIIEKIAQKFDVKLLKVRELQKEFLDRNPSTTNFKYDQYMWLLTKSVILHYIFGFSWNKVSDFNKTQLSPDFLHQNEKAGTMIKNLVNNWIKSEQN